ncbi:MAG: hypothetical protein WD875_16990 [Pirellulales bacterium]
MEEAFDPYRKWLGIPPEEQPPNHYRLLGIALFEDDADVISNAADRQMAHVRTYQTGKRAPLSQALLNELSAAKICLLDPARKHDYDRDLAARHAAMPRAVAAPAAEMPIARAAPQNPRVAVPVGAPIVIPAQAAASDPAIQLRTKRSAPVAVADAPIAVSSRGMRSRAVRRSSPSAAIGIVAAVGLLVVLVLLVAFFLGGNGGATGDANDGDRGSQRSPKSAKPDSGQPDPNRGPANTPPSTVGDGVGVPIAKSTGHDDRVTQPVKPAPPAEAPDAKHGDDGDPVASKDAPDDASPSDVSTSKPPPSDADAPPTRPAVVKKPPPPSPAAIDKAYRIVRKEFEPQLREAFEPEERFDVARQIVERAASTEEPAMKYALYVLARNLGVQMASAEQAFDVIDLLAGQFDVDGFDMKRQSLYDVAQFVTLELEDYSQLLRLTQRTAREALVAEKSDAAVALTLLSKAMSLKVRTPKALKELPRLEDLLADVDRLAADVAEYDREVKGFERNSRQLEKDANDAGANLSVGRYWLLVKGDWSKALPHLAKGADPVWKDPATIDLAQPNTAADQTALADAWYALGLRKGGYSAPRVFERAKMWYGQAIETAAEADKLAIAAKIADVEKQLKALRPSADPNATDAAAPAEGVSPDTPAAAAEPDADDAPAFPQ